MDFPERKQNRLSNYDYGLAGCYFVTLCTHGKKHIFKIEKNTTQNPSDSLQNKIIHKWIKNTENKFCGVKFEKYIIMPNHLHFIVSIPQGENGYTLQKIMQFFKTMTTNEFIREVKNNRLPKFNGKLWQKSYYDHIIRNSEDYNAIWEYVENNSAKWYMMHGGE